jgi:hypothetical protein
MKNGNPITAVTGMQEVGGLPRLTPAMIGEPVIGGVIILTGKNGFVVVGGEGRSLLEGKN